MPSWLSLVGVILGAPVGVFTLFRAADSGLNKNTKRSLSARLQRPLPSFMLSLPNQFVESFDHLFGRSITGLRFVLVSSLLSFVLALLFTLEWHYIGRPSQLARLKPALDVVDPVGGLSSFGVAWNWVWVFAVISVPADYFSTVETRLMLTRMARARTSYRVVTLIVLDAILSVCIFLAWFVCVLTGFYVWKGLSVVAALATVAAKVAEVLTYGLLLSNDTHVKQIGTSPDGMPIMVHVLTISNGIFLYASLCTSMWLWLYLTSSAIAWGAMRLEGARRQVVQWFDVDREPMLLVAYIAAALVFVILVASTLIGWLLTGS
jgi:hypothetical protein